VSFLFLVCGYSCFNSVWFRGEDLECGCLRLQEVVGRKKKSKKVYGGGHYIKLEVQLIKLRVFKRKRSFRNE
jgi:hypothetical protein